MSEIPATLTIQPTRIPDALKEIPQWVGWEWLCRNERWTKPPVNVRTGGTASSTKPETWAPYSYAIRYAHQHRLPGIGLVLTPECGIVGVDLDKCVDGDGTVADWALDLIFRFDSYSEYSPTGSGIRIFCRGTMPCKGRHPDHIGIFCGERYMTVTGNLLEGLPEAPEDRQGAIDDLLEQLGPAPERAQSGWAPSEVPPEGLRERAERAWMRRATLALLDSTGADRYASASEADSAIACGLIAAGFSADEAYTLIRDSVRGSDMPRRKRKHSDDYLRRTVDHAVGFATPISATGLRTTTSHSIQTICQGSQYSHIRVNSGHQRGSAR